MPAEKSVSWKMNVDVDARNNKLHVNLEAINTKPTWKFLQFSIFLSLSRFFIEFKSGSGTENSIPWQHERATVNPESKSSIHRNWKSKLVRFFQKLKNPSHAQKRRIARIQTPNLQHPDGKSPAEGQKSVIYENPVCIGPLLVGALALLSESIWETDEKGIIIHGCSCALLILALLFNTHVRSGKVRTLLMFLMIATLVCEVLLRLDKYICYYDQLVWKIWNYAAASGCLYEIAQVVPICWWAGVMGQVIWFGPFEWQSSSKERKSNCLSIFIVYVAHFIGNICYPFVYNVAYYCHCYCY